MLSQVSVYHKCSQQTEQDEDHLPVVCLFQHSVEMRSEIITYKHTG